ncbi:transcriptional regulator [Sphingomonas prati]|nr:transcriptional regulator [Sphingomonas prati]
MPGLTFHRHTAPTPPHVGVMDASLSLVVAGRKRVVLGNHTFDYGSTQFLLTSIDLPVTAWVTQASPTAPYLGILLGIDLAVVRALLAVAGVEEIDAATPLGIARADVTADLLDPLLRLCRLDERPAEIGLFAESVQRELIYRLITSPIGPRLRTLASIEGTSSGVVRALDWLRQNFRERQSTHALAEIARMGVSTLHRHFKTITTMSPVQYRKHLQLNEARRLMIVSGLDAASAAYDVGYESPSQFSREYRRAFGQPPISSIAGLRRSVQATATVTQR